MKVTISQDIWVLMAQFEGIMRSGMRLCFEKQGDRVEINGESVLALIMTKINFAFEDTYDVVDVMDESKEWRASSSAFKDLPVVKMTTNPERARKDEGLPLMLEPTIELRKRYQESLDEYFKDFTKIKLLAMGVNPLLTTQGVADIKVLLRKNGKGKELVNRIKQCIKEMLMDFSKDMKDPRATANCKFDCSIK
jgi:hypothetical protein